MAKKKNQPDSVVLVVGARGSGKTPWLKQYARGFGRVLVWDPKHEYAKALGVAELRRPSDLVAHLDDPHVCFCPEFVTQELFEFVCECAWRRGNTLFLAEELADVSNAGKARGWWGRLIREGAHEGVQLAAATQRPTEIDSTIRGNATRLIVFSLFWKSDRQLMAAEIDVDQSLIDPLAVLEFIDADRRARTVRRSRLVFAR